ncbi:MAG: hypothetical protein C0597_10935 [Marinilabiliales bacterium]|nr:MAG: hypothetical protein C0597_10935 [Marinilabiliales bacterium]
MRLINKISIIVLLLVSLNHIAKAQGCSDAGICTINNIKDHSFNIPNELKDRNFFKSGITFGIGEHSINVINPYLEYTGFVTNKLSLSGKITYAFVSGELANTNNLSDFIFSSNLVLFQEVLTSLNVVLGAKIPLNSSNIKEEDNPLPMHYQSSLGTYDLIVGVNYSIMDFGISMALQQPIINSNENEFIKPLDQNAIEYKYSSTNSYNRKGDVVLRASYYLKVNENKFYIRPGLLGIYHLGNDTFKDQNGVEQSINGSKGLTLNANLFLNYRFSESKQLEFSFGFPFVTRDQRPDGLTRELVSGLEYTYSF